jgi:hypothetical protein
MQVPIRPHLYGQKFDAETIRVMGLAFEMALVAPAADRGDPNEILAQRSWLLREPASAIPSGCATAC